MQSPAPGTRVPFLLRRDEHPNAGRILVPVPNREQTHDELTILSDFIALHWDAPVLCIAGDSSTSLPFLYQQLPIALRAATTQVRQRKHPHKHPSAAAASYEVRLVTHELAGKGVTPCSSGGLYVTVAPPPTPLAQPAVRWCVPRIVCRTQGLNQLLFLWTLPPQTRDTAQVLLFINTDIADRGVFPDDGGSDTLHRSEESRFLPPRQETLRSSQLLHGCLDSYLRSRGVPLKAPGCDVPLFHLRSFMTIRSQRKLRALTAIQDGVSPCSFVGLSASSNARSSLLPQYWVGGWRGGAAFTRENMGRFLRPVVYADRDWLAEGSIEAWRRHHEDSALVHTLHDTAAAVASTTVGAVVVADAGAVVVAAQEAVHRYFPIVSRVGDLLRSHCRLSDVFVLELNTDPAFLALAMASWPGDSAAAAGAACPGGEARQQRQQVSAPPDALYEATLAFSLRRGMAERQRLEQCVRELVERLCVARRSFSWSVGGDVADHPQVAVCFTYEVFSPQALAPLLEQEQRLTAPPMDAAADDYYYDRASLAEDELPTTLGYLVRSVLAQLRQRGWVLVRQEDHHVWDSAREAPVGGGEAAKETLLSRVVRAADKKNYDRQVFLSPSRNKFIPRGRRGQVQGPAASARRNANGDDAVPTGGTSLEIWQAALVSHTATHCLSLWRGAKVALPNGRRGIVVDFATPHAWVRAVTAGPAGGAAAVPLAAQTRHAEFIRWFLSSSSRPAHSWKPCLPAFMSAMERSVWPVVQFSDADGPALVLPTVVRRRTVAYPRACFVSAAQQRSVMESLPAAAPVETGAAGAPWWASQRSWRGQTVAEHRRPAKKARAMFPSDAEELRDAAWELRPDSHAVLQSRGFSSAATMHRVAPTVEDVAEMTTVALPLTIELSETPASLFYAYVLTAGGAGLWERLPATLPDSASLTGRQALQPRWRDLHFTRRAACLEDRAMGAVSPSVVPLNSSMQRLLSAKGFLHRPRALWCVAVCVPNLRRLVVDNPSFLALLSAGRTKR